jgi:hypothetical protein
MVTDTHHLLIKILKKLLLADRLEERTIAIDTAIEILEGSPDKEARELAEKLKEFKTKITTYLASSIDLLEEIKKSSQAYIKNS